MEIALDSMYLIPTLLYLVKWDYSNTSVAHFICIVLVCEHRISVVSIILQKLETLKWNTEALLNAACKGK